MVTDMGTVYEIYLPAPALRPFIECYWFLQAALRPPHQLEEMIFTDARADLVLVYSSPYLRTTAGSPARAGSPTKAGLPTKAGSLTKASAPTSAGPSPSQPADQRQDERHHQQEPVRGELMRASNLDAPRRYPVHIRQQGNIDLVGVRFRPAGLAPFVRFPVNQLSGWTVSLFDTFGRPGVELEGKLFDARDHRSRQLALLDDFFLSRLTLHPAYHHVKGWMETLERRRGLVSIQQLSRDSGYSIRTVDRLFQQFVGLSPKFFARTVRFRHVHRHLMRHPECDWEDVVVSCGYFDQSHFAKDVLSLAGVSPKAYRAFLLRERDSLPPNFVQFLQDT